MFQDWGLFLNIFSFSSFGELLQIIFEDDSTKVFIPC